MRISTRTRIACARVLYQGISVGRGPWRSKEVTVTRQGLRWQLDLREGIDLSIYAFRSFEPSVARAYRSLVKPGDVVLDIGANVGAHTLPLARAVGETGRVVAFEPTAWAFAKLEANLALNPELACRVRAEQVMLVGEEEAALPASIYSSWPLVSGREVHAQHRGQLMATDQARAVTLDAYAAAHVIDRVDLVKLDVDGAEPDVLRGGRETLARCRPVLVMELAPYIYDGTDGFEQLLGSLEGHGYRIEHLRTRCPFPPDPEALRRRVPPGSSMNVLCIPPG